MSFEITRDHILFFDAQKLRMAHRALLGCEARRKLAARYLASPKVRRMVLVKEAPEPSGGPSIHKLIPTDPGFTYGKDSHIMGNLARFVAGKVRRGETFEEALLSFATRPEGGGSRDYAKFAKRWARKLKLSVA